MIGFGCAHSIKLTLDASTLRYGLVIFITMKLVRMFIPGSSRAGLLLIELAAAGFASNRCQRHRRQSPDHDAARGNQPDARSAPDSITSPSRAGSHSASAGRLARLAEGGAAARSRLMSKRARGAIVVEKN